MNSKSFTKTLLLITIGSLFTLNVQASLQSEYKTVCTPNADGAVYTFYFNTLDFQGKSDDGQYAYSSARVSVGVSDDFGSDNLEYTDDTATMTIRSPFNPVLIGVVTTEPDGKEITFLNDEENDEYIMYYPDSAGNVQSVSAECSIEIVHPAN